LVGVEVAFSKWQHLGCRRFHNNEKVKMSIGEWLRMQEPDFYWDGIFKLVPGWDKCVSVLWDNGNSVE
jgi:hypothetical protein